MQETAAVLFFGGDAYKSNLWCCWKAKRQPEKPTKKHIQKKRVNPDDVTLDSLIWGEEIQIQVGAVFVVHVYPH